MSLESLDREVCNNVELQSSKQGTKNIKHALSKSFKNQDQLLVIMFTKLDIINSEYIYICIIRD